MSSGKNTYRLFSGSGCLSQEALCRYLGARVTNQELEDIQMHLSGCELCRDALEGFSHLSDPDLTAQQIQAIQTELEEKFTPRQPQTPARKIGFPNRIGWYAAAASIVILMGLLYFLTNNLDLTKNRNMAQEVSTDHIQIPPVPQVNEPAFNKETTLNTAKNHDTLIKNKTEGNQLTGADEATQAKRLLNETKKTAHENDKITPLKIQKPKSAFQVEKIIEPSIANQSEAAKLTADETDIASNQPVEYYLGEIVIYSHAEALNTAGVQVLNDAALPEISAAESRAPAFTNAARLKSSNTANKSAEDAPERRSENEHFFTVVDQMPEFPGGRSELEKYLSQHIQYPVKAARMSIQGTVMVSFIVEKDGSITHAKIINGIGGGCDEEALRVIESMPAWQPAIKAGLPMRAIFNMPVKFRLSR